MSHQVVKFYKKEDAFYEFSNFYKAAFELDGKSWPTTEHYFQAAKFPDHPEYQEIIRNCSTPGKCFTIAQQKKKGGYAVKWAVNPKTGDNRLLNDIITQYKDTVRIRVDWDDVRISVMTKCLTAKFSQNECLKNLLLSTGKKHIIEDSPRDDYWGIGKNNNGQNHLGRLLMEVREELQAM